MKPTDKQKAIAKVICQQGAFWGSTNDINSPTHYCDIDEEISSRLDMEFDFEPDQLEELSDLLEKLYQFVRKNP